MDNRDGLPARRLSFLAPAAAAAAAAAAIRYAGCPLRLTTSHGSFSSDKILFHSAHRKASGKSRPFIQ